MLSRTRSSAAPQAGTTESMHRCLRSLPSSGPRRQARKVAGEYRIQAAIGLPLMGQEVAVAQVRACSFIEVGQTETALHAGRSADRLNVSTADTF